MTKSQRRLFLTLHAVREMANGMTTTGKLTSKSRASLGRILARVGSEIDALGPATAADARAFTATRDRLVSTWTGDEVAMSRPAFVCVALALVADHRATLPKTATATRATCAALEGMLFTLYRHFDPDMADTKSMNQGEQIALEYRAVVAAA